MENKLLVYGIVGAGYIANNVHLPIISKIEGTKVDAICDEDEAKARATAKIFKIPKAYTDFNEMLEKENLDVVDVLTPPSTHANIAISILKSGRHCLVEKPLTTTVADADKVIRVAKEENRALHVIHNFSFMPCMRRANQIMSADPSGESTNIDVKYLTSFEVEMQRYLDPLHWCHGLPGDVFYDLSPHLIMLLLDFLQDVKNVKVLTIKLSDDPRLCADELKVIVEGNHGLGSLAISFNSPARCFTIDVVRRTCRLCINADNQIVIKHKPLQSKDVASLVSKGSTTLGEIYQQLAGLSSNAFFSITGKYKAVHKESHSYLLSESVRSLQGRGTYPVDLWKCREVVRLLEEIFGTPSQNDSICNIK
jgi:predicted dehydrogenase